MAFIEGWPHLRGGLYERFHCTTFALGSAKPLKAKAIIIGAKAIPRLGATRLRLQG